MTMGIYIPSLSRSSNIHFGVARFASPEMLRRMIYVVPEDQVEKYRTAIEKETQGRLGKASPEKRPSVVGCPEKGIAATRRWIGEWARQADHDKFLMLDDDVWFYTRTTADPANAKLEYSEPGQVDATLAAVELALDTYAHVGISAREGNNRLDKKIDVPGLGGVTAISCTRTLRALAYQTEEFLKCEHGRVPVQEDFDVNLQLLGRGLPNINLAHWAQGQRQTNAPGGCSTYRTHEVQDQAARKLAELHPGVVTLRQKENKSGGEFGHRTEVTIQWQRKYKMGLEWRKTQE